jgi:hypothetical protein
LHEDQLAEVPQVGEPAPAPAQEVRIEILEGLLQLAEGSHAVKAWKSLTKIAKWANFYEQARSARDGHFCPSSKRTCKIVFTERRDLLTTDGLIGKISSILKR